MYRNQMRREVRLSHTNIQRKTENHQKEMESFMIAHQTVQNNMFTVMFQGHQILSENQLNMFFYR